MYNKEWHSSKYRLSDECNMVNEVVGNLQVIIDSNKWENSNSRRERTKLIKDALADLGSRYKLRVNAHDLSKEKVEILKKCDGINEYYYPNREWLLDMIWSREDEKSKYETREIVLGMECEWGFKRPTDTDVYGQVKYDFLKLIVVEARLSVMIFRWRKEDDDRIGQDELSMYFGSVVNGYKGVLNNTILCIGFHNDYRSFVYRLYKKEKREISKVNHVKHPC